MAKRRYRRFRRRSGRWSVNIQEFNESITGAAGTFSANSILVSNPIQTVNTVSQQYTVKNIEATFEFEPVGASTTSTFENLTCYIMYVPQGMNITNNYNLEHPEYIMNYRFIGSPTVDDNPGRNPIKVRTRLARRLQTGDQIVLFVKGFNNITSGSTQVELKGIVRWWTKAN